MNNGKPNYDFALNMALLDMLVDYTTRMPGDKRYVEVAGVEVLQICPDKPSGDFVVRCFGESKTIFEIRITYRDELYHRTFSQKEKELFSIAEGRIATKRKERLARAARKEPGIGDPLAW